jgi:hypothetical protein
MTYTGDVSREIEPSWCLRNDDVIVMVFRDQNSTFRRLASVHNSPSLSENKRIEILVGANRIIKISQQDYYVNQSLPVFIENYFEV